MIFAANNGVLFSQSSASLTFSQTMSEDWRQGKYSSLEVNINYLLAKSIQIDKFTLDLSQKSALGLKLEKKSSLDKETLFPTDNELAAEGKLTYNAGWPLDPFFLASFQTQLTESFSNYKGNLTPTAKLWDPVTSVESWGMSYKLKNKVNYLVSRIAFSLKQIRADSYPALTDNFETEQIEKYKHESGITTGFDAYLMIDSSTTYKSTFELFNTFDRFSRCNVLWRNEIQIKIWKFFGILIKADIIYDETQIARVQYKQSSRLGIVQEF